MKKIKRKLADFLTSISIELKIYGMVICVVLLVTAISMFVVRFSVTQSLTTQIEDRAKSISTDIASRSIDLLLTNNIYALQSLISDTMENHQDVEYIFILESDDVIVHSSESKTISNQLITANQPNYTKRVASTNIKNLNTTEGEILDSASPIIPDIGGTVRVGLTYESLNRTLAKISTQMLYTTFGVLFLAALIVYGLTTVLTTPISQLVHLTNKVPKGEMSERIQKYGNDEIGKLTRSFNHMLDELEHAENEKALYIGRIKNRNKELSLLNDLSKNFTSIEQLREMLNNFVTHLVEELNLKSVVIKVRVAEKWERFNYNSEECLRLCSDKDINCMPSKCNCEKRLENHIYSFQLKSKTDEKIGEILICSKKELDDSFLNILKTLTNQLAISVENIELWNMLKKKEEVRLMLLEKIINAQEEERKRIARELHDETSHSLSSMLVELKLLAETEKEMQTESIEKLRNLVQKTIEEVHQLGWQLRPSILDKFGLKVAIERYVEEFKQHHQLEIDLIISGSFNELLPELNTAIFRLVQESLTNISRHAQARLVNIIILSTNHHISVIVEDDGVGFDVNKMFGNEPSKDHLGLLGMYERVSLFGGTLDIESTVDEGTTVIAKIPHLKESSDIIAN